jgi:hypothetical protein
VRRTSAVVVLAFAAAAAPAAARGQAPPPEVTLKAPKATQFNHRIEFVGHMTPAAAGIRVRLLRGTRLVAVTLLRGDGTFRIPVKIANPGPFHVQVAQLRSSDVTVELHPILHLALAKGRVRATVQPPEAGAIRVTVTRNGRQTFEAAYRTQASVQLAPLYGQVEVRAQIVPRAGYVAVERAVTTQVVPPALSYGSASPAVADLWGRLSALHYVVPAVRSQTFDGDFLQSVYAFEKAQSLERTGVVDAAFWRRLDHPLELRPRYLEPAAHIEIDKTRQILMLVRNGGVTLVSPVSTAGIAGYYTPVGRFAIYRKVTGYDPSPLGVLLDPMYFVGGYAIHGNPSVPPYPASHGCVRVPNFVIARLFPSEPYGEIVYVY